MYLHHLELRAIGPYPDRVVIDFAALAASGVFLLEGPTGSGKSTIIDAVVFALYGGLAGSDASNDRLHSQHADPAVEPFVELVFETGAGLYRVRRTPQYDRPKQRGTGTVRQNASAALHRLSSPTDPAGEPVSARAQEIGAEITRIVGLDRAQFLQTVVLPQGEFARFLRAPGEDRRKLLQSLFGTQVYDRTADELVARRRAAAAQVESADARVRDALARFAEASGADELDESAVPDVVVGLRSSADAAAQARAAAVAASTAATEHEQSVSARVTALGRRRALLTRVEALAASAPVVDAARTRLGLAERAGRVAAVADGLDAAVRRADRAHADRDALRAQHLPHDGDSASPRDAAGERDRVVGVVGAVRHLVDVARALPDRRRALDRDRTQIGTLDLRLTELQTALDARPSERAQIVEASRAAATAAADAEPAQRETETVQALRDAHTALTTALDRVGVTEAAVVTARVAATDAARVEHDLRERRIAGLAGELGAALQPGDACPVCGAHEHPAVAVPQDDHPTPEQIDTAASVTRQADQDLADAATDLALERAERDRLLVVVGDSEPADLDRRAADAAERVRTAHAAAARVAEHERAKAAHDEATAGLQREHTDVATRRHVLDATTTADDERLAQDAAAVDTAQATLTAELPADDAPGTLPDAVAALDARATALGAVAQADDLAHAADAALVERRVEVDRVLADQSFADVDTARAARLDPADAERLRIQVADADRERAVVDAGLAEPDVVAAAADEHPEPDGAVPPALDLDAARATVAAAAQALEAASHTATTRGERALAAERCAADLRRAVEQRDAVSTRSRAVVRLADVAAGAPGYNTTGVTLGTYVLMRRFEDVVAAANDRLGTMLGGRFALETSDERESGTRARRTGLALAVRDHTTDTTRDPRSLSGGETFTVSLCLALGLADVVQAEAGGVSLGTLFVDEGFGTLDPETLDGVIDQLAKLTAGGRQVGIVSHVEELKQRIPERIAVRRMPGGGSRVSTTV